LPEFWIDEVLEEHRPKGAPTRRRAVYAFQALSNALAFASRYRRPRLFEVVVADSFLAPMVLVEHLRWVGREHPEAIEVATQYWRGGQGWRVVEYLATGLVVLGRLPIRGGSATLGTEREIGLEAYEADKRRAMRLWPGRPLGKAQRMTNVARGDAVPRQQAGGGR
jgi:hypothetical protein